MSVVAGALAALGVLVWAPGSAEAQSLRATVGQGWTYMEAGNLRKAEEAFMKAFESPEGKRSAEVYYGIAAVWWERRNAMAAYMWLSDAQKAAAATYDWDPGPDGEFDQRIAGRRRYVEKNFTVIKLRAPKRGKPLAPLADPPHADPLLVAFTGQLERVVKEGIEAKVAVQWVLAPNGTYWVGDELITLGGGELDPSRADSWDLLKDGGKDRKAYDQRVAAIRAGDSPALALAAAEAAAEREAADEAERRRVREARERTERLAAMEAERAADDARRAEEARRDRERRAEQARIDEERREAEARRAEEDRAAREAAEARRAEEDRAAREAAEARRAEEARLEQERREAAEARREAEEARRAEEARLEQERREAAEARRAEEARVERERREAEEARRAEEARVERERREAEEARRAEEARVERERREAAKARRAEEARVERERREAEEARRAEEARLEQKRREAAEARRTEEARAEREADEARRAEEARIDRERREAAEARAAEEARRDREARREADARRDAEQREIREQRAEDARRRGGVDDADRAAAIEAERRRRRADAGVAGGSEADRLASRRGYFAGGVGGVGVSRFSEDSTAAELHPAAHVEVGFVAPLPADGLALPVGLSYANLPVSACSSMQVRSHIASLHLGPRIGVLLERRAWFALTVGFHVGAGGTWTSAGDRAACAGASLEADPDDVRYGVELKDGDRTGRVSFAQLGWQGYTLALGPQLDVGVLAAPDASRVYLGVSFFVRHDQLFALLRGASDKTYFFRPDDGAGPELGAATLGAVSGTASMARFQFGVRGRMLF